MCFSIANSYQNYWKISEAAVICFFLENFDKLLPAEKCQHIFVINLLQIEIHVMKLRSYQALRTGARRLKTNIKANFLLEIKPLDYEFKIVLGLKFCQLVTVEKRLF